MSIATDVRAYADLALEQGKNALSQAGAAVNNANKRLAADAPKPVLAALGVADMVAETLTKQVEALSKRAETVGKRVESLPADAIDNVTKAQQSGKALLSRTQDDTLARINELRDLLDTGVGSAKALPTLSVTAVSTTTVYLSNARHVFEKLTARGESRLAELRNDPRVTRLMGDLDEASSAVQSRLAPVLGSVRSEVVPYLDSAFDAIKDADLGEPAAAAPARRSTGTRRSTAAGRATGATSAARRSPATKSAAAKTTAKSTAGKRSSAGSRAKATTGSADKASARTALDTKASATSARKAPASKASVTSARKAPASKASATSARKAPAKKA
ncbi:MAG: hypothetical protein ABI047_15120 [Jatrophihabitantaceae bacterium]